MTAVEWLNINMPNVGHYIPMGVALELHAKFQEAERMHEKQIKDAFIKGFSEGVVFGTVTIYKFQTSEQYYNQTYKTQAQ